MKETRQYWVKFLYPVLRRMIFEFKEDGTGLDCEDKEQEELLESVADAINEFQAFFYECD